MPLPFENIADARTTLLNAGARDLPRPPWSRPSFPPSDALLVEFAVRRTTTPHPQTREEIRAALRLMESARIDLDALESSLLLAARCEGLTWPEIASDLGVRSPQAAQQRFQRLNERVGGVE